MLALWLSITSTSHHQHELQRTCQFLAFGLRYRNVVSISAVSDLTTKRSPIRPVRMPLRAGKLLPLHPPGRNQRLRHGITLQLSLFCRTFFRTSINFGNLISVNVMRLTKLFPVYEHCRNAHHVAIGDFVLEGAAVNCVCLMRGFSMRSSGSAPAPRQGSCGERRVIGFGIQNHRQYGESAPAETALLSTDDHRSTATPVPARGGTRGPGGSLQTWSLVGTWVGDQERRRLRTGKLLSSFKA